MFLTAREHVILLFGENSRLLGTTLKVDDDKITSLLLTTLNERRIAMKNLILLVVMLAIVLLASAPALTQTTPSNLEMSPAQEMQTDQTVGNTDVAQPAR